MKFAQSLLPGQLINRSSRLLSRWIDGQFRDLGLAIAQAPVFYALNENGSLTQKDLAKIAQVEQPTMALLLTRMERDGLIQRSAHPDDRRSSLVSLTPLALKKMPRARALLIEGNAAALKGMSDREIATLCRLLQRVVDNMTSLTTFEDT